MAILITGVAGFIGYHVAREFLRRGDTVLGIDNFSSNLALADIRLARLDLEGGDRFIFRKGSVSDKEGLEKFIGGHTVTLCIHLAARAGVQESEVNPKPYIDTNFRGFETIIQLCQSNDIPLVYASSASVYGNTSDHDGRQRESLLPLPTNLYGISKYYNELVAKEYWDRHAFPSIGLRFFNVYGTWGRPESFLYKLLQSTPDKIVAVNHMGAMERDFTHVSDIVHGIWLATEAVTHTWKPQGKVFNLGNDSPVKLRAAVSLLGGFVSYSDHLPPGEIVRSWSDNSFAKAALTYQPAMGIESGLAALRHWWDDVGRDFYSLSETLAEGK